jgi:FMN-dependent NADH-azoreductase
MKLLHIDSSILGPGSASRPIGAAIVERLKAAVPGLEIAYRDLAAAPLPHVTPAEMPGDHPLSAMAPSFDAAVRAESQAVLDEFVAADIVVIGAPMYNFTIPSQLKAWLDRILVPGRTFSYGENGPQGLAAGKRVIVAISRGGLYGADSPYAAFEHAETYLRAVFGFIGVTNVEIVLAEGLQRGPELRQAALDGALKAAAALKAA